MHAVSFHLDGLTGMFGWVEELLRELEDFLQILALLDLEVVVVFLDFWHLDFAALNQREHFKFPSAADSADLPVAGERVDSSHSVLIVNVNQNFLAIFLAISLV